MSDFFSKKTFNFLNALAANNSREWFAANKGEYESQVKQPFLRVISALQTPLAAISPHYCADPRAVGGSLFRIHRDTRFSNDKTPYKTHAGAKFFHERSKTQAAPVFYFHLQSGECFVGAGLWHPEAPVQRKIREFIDANPGTWMANIHAPEFKKNYPLGGESLQRPPRGFPADHPLIEDIKRKDFVASIKLKDSAVLSAELPELLSTHCQGLAPLVDYLCAALDLEF